MPCASLQQVLPARDTAGLRQEFIALTFLGSFGWISLPNPFLPAAPQIVASFGLPVSSVLSPRHENSSSRLDTESSRRSSVKIPGETSRTMLPSDRTLLASALKLFPRTSRRRFSGPTTNEGHLSREKASHLDFVSFLGKLDIN